eukprot:6195856-Amphidinium_carterae.1
MMLLAAAHGARGHKEKMRELYEKAFAKCKWENSSMSIDEASTSRISTLELAASSPLSDVSLLRSLGKLSRGRGKSLCLQ